MYRVDRNNFYTEQKNATVYTPEPVSRFLFNLVSKHISKRGTVLDPCVGKGSLLMPFEEDGFRTFGIDIEDQGYPNTVIENFIAVQVGQYPKPSLVIANPPFNVDTKTKDLISADYGRRPLLPEVWLQKIVQLWGTETPIVLFTPYGLRLNQSLNSKRWRKFLNGDYPRISSIVALPKDVYEGVIFHSEVLIFNMPKLQGHYFYDG